MKDDDVPAWRLIAVLQSTVSLTPALSLTLYRAAARLHRDGEEVGEVAEREAGVGLVRNLRRELLLGTFGGPGFEASVDTPAGSGTVRFIVTREGLEHAEAVDARRRELERKHWN